MSGTERTHVNLTYNPERLREGLHFTDGYKCAISTGADNPTVNMLVNMVLNTKGAELGYRKMEEGMHVVEFTAKNTDVLHQLANTIHKNTNMSVSGLEGFEHSKVSHTGKPDMKLQYHVTNEVAKSSPSLYL